MQCERCGHRQGTDIRDLVPVVQAAVTIPILRRLARIEYYIRTGDQAEMTALEDLQAADAQLASAVTDLTGSVQALSDGVTQLDTAFDELKNAVGNDPQIAAEVAKVQAALDSLKTAKDQADAAKGVIDEDFPAEPAPGTPGAGEGTPDSSNPASIV